MPVKSKAAKGRADVVDADEAREVLQTLECGAPPPAATLLKVFRLNMGPCSASCGKGGKGSKDNPCCLHGLLPAEGGFRKKGLWQKEPVLGQLGYDPADDKRKAPGVPAGLRNLGNTCYVNAAMQFLHSLPAFRNALYKLEPELAEQQIVKQMRDLFIEMHFGPKRYVDPEPFANSLLLDHAIQQDGQEFLKLLLSKLEVVFGASQQQDVSTVVQGLFQGHLSHVTTCHTCKRPSEGSKREVEFYELSLQVQQMPSLHDSLVAALAPDELVGDNQYFCDFCAAKSDADRRMRLRNLPPYLCLALQRFTYDHQTWEKKKVLHKLSIPLRLDMGQVLVDAGLDLPEAAPLGPDSQRVLPGSDNSVYELAAVLIHKGTSASHGHYVAHIKLHDTNTWWRFDDEEAVEMGLQPTSHPGDHGSTAAAAAAAAATAAGTSAGAAAAAGTTSADDTSSKPAVGKKRGRGASAGGAGGAKRGKGYARGGRGGKKGKRGGKKDPWDEGSDADAEAEAATAAAEARADEDAALRHALNMSLLDAHGNGDVALSEAELQATLKASAAPQPNARSRRKAADAGSAANRGRGRGRGRSKSKAAAVEVEGDAGAAAAGEAAEATVPAEEQAGAVVPQAIVDQIVSANAYFLVYRHCLCSSTTTAGQQAAAAAEEVAAVKQEQQPTQQQEQPLQAHDQNVQPPQQQARQPAEQQLVTKQESALQQADTAQQQQPRQPPEGVSEQQLPLAAQQLQAQLQELPEAVQQQVAQLHRDFDEMCGRFQQRRQEAMAAVEHRKREVSDLTELLPEPEGSTEGCFVCLKWLDGWLNNEGQPDPVDNSVLLCEEHRKLNPLLLPGTFKYISSTAWEQLTAQHKGGPRLTCSDVCQDCLQRLLQGLVNSEDLVGLREQLLSALDIDEAAQDMRMQAASSYFISKTWMLGFRRRSSTSTGSKPLEPPTAGIACPHGRLAPEGRSGAAKRLAVSPDTWSLLKRLWPQQVLWDVQARRDKAKRAAAKRAATGGVDAAAVADAAKDDDCIILDSPVKGKQPPQPPQEQGQQQPEVQVIDGGDDDVVMTDADAHHQQQPDSTADRGSSPGAGDTAEAGVPAGPSSWQLPFPLDGSEPLSESKLLQALPEFTVSNDYECPDCESSLREAAEGHQEVKQQLEGQKQALGKLLAGNVTEALQEGSVYYLVPNSWLDIWRKHLQAALSKKLVVPAQLPPAPELLPQAIRALMCKCHPPDQPLLAVPLPAVANKRGRFSQADPLNDALRVVSEQDWQHLLLYYSGLDADGDAGAAAGTCNHQQHMAPAAADGAGSTRPTRRRSGRSAQQQPDVNPSTQLERQEQQDIVMQRISSMADTDPAFRGIRAWLKVAAVDVPPQQRQQDSSGVEQQQRPAEQLTVMQDGLQQPAQRQLHGVNGLSTDHQRDAACAGPPSAVPEQRGKPMRRGRSADPAAAAGASNGAAPDGEAVDLTSSPPQAPKRSKRQRHVLDLLNSPTAQAAADTDVVLVESVDLATEGPAQADAAARASAGSNGHADDVQVVCVHQGALQDAQEDPQPDSTAGRSKRQKQVPQRTAAAAARLRRPPQRGASAGVAAAVEAAAAADSLEGVGTDDEAVAVAAAAAAVAAQRGWLETEPGLCETTLQAEAAARRAATLVYDEAELMVELIAEEELQSAFGTAVAGERRSRRARKNRQPVKACSTDTLAMLKLKVFEVLSVHPANQRLYVRGQLVEGEDFTLARLEIFPDEEIRVVNANQVPDDDYASVFDGVAGKRKAREVETGFRDTALQGSSVTAAAMPPQDSAQGSAGACLVAEGDTQGLQPQMPEQQQQQQQQGHM